MKQEVDSEMLLKYYARDNYHKKKIMLIPYKLVLVTAPKMKYRVGSIHFLTMYIEKLKKYITIK